MSAVGTRHTHFVASVEAGEDPILESCLFLQLLQFGQNLKWSEYLLMHIAELKRGSVMVGTVPYLTNCV